MGVESRFTSDRRSPGERTTWDGSNDWRAGEATGVDIIDQKLKRRNPRQADVHEHILTRYQCDHSFETSTLTDSVGSRHGSISGPKYTTEAKWGNLALEFSRARSDRIHLPDFPSRFMAEGAVSLWLRPDETITQYPVWIGKGGSSNSGKARSLIVDGSKIGFVGWGQNVFAGGVLQTGSWIHVMYTWKAPSEAMVYVNGEFAAGTDSITLQDSGQSNSIGYRRTNQSNHYGGIIDDIRLFDAMLGHQDAEIIYNSY